MLCSLLLINIRYKKENKVILDGLELFIFFCTTSKGLLWTKPHQPTSYIKSFPKKKFEKTLKFY